MATGTATLDFGVFAAGTDAIGHPQTEASVAVTGQGAIVAGSALEAWVRVEPAGSADHSMDEHRLENLHISAGNIVAGTGFTIYGECLLGGTYGAFTVNWAWV
jgi:hypothetical protein